MPTPEKQFNVSMLPIKEAAEHVSYSRDYVARLAREGAVVAKLEGRGWCVDLDSLKCFAADAAMEREVRRRQLRAERRAERDTQERLLALASEAEAGRTRAAHVAQSAVALVLALGVVLGQLALQTALPSELVRLWELPHAANVHFAADTDTDPHRDATPQGRVVDTTLPLTPLFTSEREQHQLTSEDGLLVLGAAHLRELDRDEIARLFSHEVLLQRDADGVRRIFRVGPNGEPVGRGVPFVTLPSPEVTPTGG